MRAQIQSKDEKMQSAATAHSRRAQKRNAFLESGIVGGIANSPRVVAQRQQKENLFGAVQRKVTEFPAQAHEHSQPNRTGLPDNLKSGVESLSGISMDNVRVHFNSSKPLQFNALAYTQGSKIHVAPGQKKHLPHEAWHVVQQAQGRVRPTMQMKGVSVNDDGVLEHEADVMGAKATIAMPPVVPVNPFPSKPRRDETLTNVVQRQPVPGFEDITEGNVPPQWVQDYLDDVMDTESHLYIEDLTALLGNYVPAGEPSYGPGTATLQIGQVQVQLVNSGDHFNVTIGVPDQPPRNIRTRADGSCGVHAVHAVLAGLGQFPRNQTASDENYFADDGFVTASRQFILHRLIRLEEDMQLVRHRISDALQHAPNLAETGFGRALHGRLSQRAEEAQRRLAEEEETQRRPLGRFDFPAPHEVFPPRPFFPGVPAESRGSAPRSGEKPPRGGGCKRTPKQWARREEEGEPQPEDRAGLKRSFEAAELETRPATMMASAEPQVPVDMDKVDRFLKTFLAEKHWNVKFEIQPMRVFIDSTDIPILHSLLKNRPKKKGGPKKKIDLTYHELVQALDAEYEEFIGWALEAGLTLPEAIEAYHGLRDLQHCSVSGQLIQCTGPLPCTAMAPTLLKMFHGTHYVERLVKGEDTTASTRSYEASYAGEAFARLPFLLWRSMVLPSATSSEEGTMVGAIGASLDVQLSTSSGTIGRGRVVYSAIYKHFQRAMELLNQRLDELEEIGRYSPDEPGAFEARTALHTRLLDKWFLQGLLQNEKERFSGEEGFKKWSDLEEAIHSIVGLVEESLRNLPADESADFEVSISLSSLQHDETTMLKRAELVGTILGLMMKKEKRLLLNLMMLGADPFLLFRRADNLERLARIERKVSEQVEQIQTRIGQLQRMSQARKQITKELQGLDWGMKK